MTPLFERSFAALAALLIMVLAFHQATAMPPGPARALSAAPALA